MRTASRRVPLALIAAAAICFPRATRAVQPVPKPHERDFEGLSYQLVEFARDGDFPVPPQLGARGEVLVDANAVLRLEFKSGPSMTAVEATGEWKALSQLLAETEHLAAEWSRLNAAEIDLADSAAVGHLQREALAIGKGVMALLASLQSRLALTPDHLLEVLSGRAPGGTGDPKRAYENLVAWLGIKLAVLQDEAIAVVDTAGSLERSVLARLEPRVGEPKWIHVPDYDLLPEGKLEPIPRASLRLAPQEERFLSMAWETNGKVVEAFRTIAERGPEIRDELRALVDSSDAIFELTTSIAKELATRVGSLDSVIAGLRHRAGVAGEEAARARDLRALADSLEAFQRDFRRLRSMLEYVSELRSDLASGRFVDPTTAFLAPDGILSRLQSASESLLTAETLIKDWGSRATRVRDLVAGLGTTLAEEIRAGVLIPELESAVDSLRQRLPTLSTAVATIVEVVRLGASFHGATVTAGGIEDKLLRHEWAEGPPAIIELRRVGLLPGDAVSIRMNVFDQKSGKEVHREDWDVRAELIGWRRRISSHFVFSRPRDGTGEGTKWKPNVAALANWSYYKRNPHGLWCFWNGLGLGAGIHLASLDQGDDSVEFGVGGNFVVWNGLVSAGYGYNLSVSSEREYYLLGVDLFDVLNAMRGSRKDSSAAAAAPGGAATP